MNYKSLKKKRERVMIGILHFGASHALEALLASIPLLYHSRVVILDHNLTRNTAVGPWAQVHDPSNPGYSIGMNRLIRRALDEQVSFFIGLTNDLILKHGALESFLEILKTSKLTGVQGVLMDGESKILTAAQRLNPYFHWVHNGFRHRFLDTVEPDKIWSTDFICGAFFGLELTRFSKAPVFFDEDFFLYHEDIEWSKRLKFQGHSLGVLPAAQAIHAESLGTGGKISREGILARWCSLKIYLKKTRQTLPFSLISTLAFWLRMLWFWRKYGWR